MPTLLDRTSDAAPPAVSTDLRTSRSMDDLIAPQVAGALLAAWVLGLAWLFSIAPDADPSEPITAFDLFIANVMLGSWVAVFAGLSTRRRFGIAASIVGGLLVAGAGVLCGLAGHTGLWIAVQIGVGVGLAGLGTAAAKVS